MKVDFFFVCILALAFFFIVFLLTCFFTAYVIVVFFSNNFNIFSYFMCWVNTFMKVNSFNVIIDSLTCNIVIIFNVELVCEDLITLKSAINCDVDIITSLYRALNFLRLIIFDLIKYLLLLIAREYLFNLRSFFFSSFSIS